MVDLELDYTDYIYNVFIISNQEDYHWIDNLLQPKIEDEWEMHLCLEYRDFVGGAPIAECIMDAIERSEKTILVLTNGFLQNKWCEFSMQMALARGQQHTLILCVMEELDLRELSRVLRCLLRSDTTHGMDNCSGTNRNSYNMLVVIITHYIS